MRRVFCAYIRAHRRAESRNSRSIILVVNCQSAIINTSNGQDASTRAATITSDSVRDAVADADAHPHLSMPGLQSSSRPNFMNGELDIQACILILIIPIAKEMHRNVQEFPSSPPLESDTSFYAMNSLKTASAMFVAFKRRFGG